jgi:hypothetical protein
MNADGTNLRTLDTGSPSFVPEGSPSWSPAGDRIAFTSARTNTSQVFVIAAAGGEPTQLSHESGGAFDPAWSADGSAIHFLAVAGGARIMRVPAAGGTASRFAEDELGVSEIACGPTACLATVGPLDAGGDIIAISRDGRMRQTALAGTMNARQPAILVPQ